MPVRPPVFRPFGQRPRRQVKAEHDARRGSARDRGYDTRWDKLACAFKREHPLCLGCSAVGRVTAAEVVDHIVPHKGDQYRFWDRANLQPACQWHHDVVKQRLELLFDRGEIAPASLSLASEKAIALTRELDPGGI